MGPRRQKLDMRKHVPPEGRASARPVSCARRSVLVYSIQCSVFPVSRWFTFLSSFIPITFELTVLGASLTAFFCSLGLSGLPQPYHPMFNLPEFERASQDRFFLCIEAADPQFDTPRTRSFLESLDPLTVKEVAK